MTPGSYEYGGARAMVALHAKYLRAFVVTWRRADNEAVALPASENPNYASRQALLAHVLGGAARYLIWMCEKLELPAPNLEERPDPGGFAARADEYPSLLENSSYPAVEAPNCRCYPAGKVT